MTAPGSLDPAEHLHAASEYALDAADKARLDSDRDRDALLAVAHGVVGLALLFDERTARLLHDIKTGPADAPAGPGTTHLPEGTES